MPSEPSTAVESSTGVCESSAAVCESSAKMPKCRAPYRRKSCSAVAESAASEPMSIMEAVSHAKAVSEVECEAEPELWPPEVGIPVVAVGIVGIPGAVCRDVYRGRLAVDDGRRLLRRSSRSLRRRLSMQQPH